MKPWTRTLAAALLAATSPQTPVHENFNMATRLFAKWVQAGRPQDRESILAMGRAGAVDRNWHQSERPCRQW